MQKEILTRSIIKKELKRKCFSGLLGGMIFLPFYALMCILLVFLLILFINLIVPNKVTLNIISIVLCILLGIVYLQAFSSQISFLMKALKGDFQISSDWVVDKLPARHGRYNHRPNTLVFARSGDYGITDDFCYKWSALYSMSDESLFNCSVIDDDFYVVSVGKKKCVLAYNKKMFELKE